MKPFLSLNEIEKILDRIAAELSNTFPEDESVVFLAVGNDSLKFTSDLMNKVSLPVSFDTIYVEVIDYPEGTDSPITKFHKMPQLEIHDKNVVLVDVCTKKTPILRIVKNKLFKVYEPRSVTFCSLLKEKYSEEYLHYFGKVMPKNSVPHGYGISLNGLNSNAPEIHLDKK